MENTVLLSGARTPIGKLSGSLSGFSAAALGGIAITGALERAKIDPHQVDYVIMGQVLQAGTGQVTARQAAVAAGIPMSTPAITINKVCLSGLNAIYLAAQMIEAGDAQVVVAGGMESMTNAPYLIPKGRGGYRYGNSEILDVIQHDGLFCALEKELMGEGTERYAASASLIEIFKMSLQLILITCCGRNFCWHVKRRNCSCINSATERRPYLI